MKKINVLYLTLAVLVFITPACIKRKGCNDPNCINYDPKGADDNSKCRYGGTGGNTSIKATLDRNGTRIVGTPSYLDSAFVKFNTQESPGLDASSYDLVIEGVDRDDHVHIEHMKPGKYFIMVAGYDPIIKKRVTGSIPYILNDTSGEVRITIPVKETE